ncbi:unnamed protein product [Vicia faba]|uniref:Protein kinase domain-containing protein n=1 Tax=Vicia faba TaxID=3906 RepID=A0AAV0ZFV0_VICFA|nr:unnamed protein product [Vicia faba]
MATYFMFRFVLLSSYFLLLLSAASYSEYDKECVIGRNTWCGYLGEFPLLSSFTTVNKSECGFYISGCDNNTSEKKILLKNQMYIVVSMNHMHNSIIIYDPSSSELDLESLFRFAYFPISIFTRSSGCSIAGGLCLSDQEILTINCVSENEQHFKTLSEDYSRLERKERHLKAAVRGLSIGLATVIAIALFVIILLLYYRRIKSSGLKNQSRANYRGLSRNTTIPESGAVYLGIPVFSYEELQKATDNFNQARELGEGGFGTVYYGKLGDGREVAVKRLFERSYRPVESFTNEIQILTRMRHRNLVSLYGCTSRHSRELLLVYEYIPNGTVNSHLHNKKENQSSSLPWAVRMKIAIETAGALTYLHASDVIHRDVKTSNILLDNSFCVKVADFGLSRLYPNDVTHVSTAPRGTPGYVDPEYRLCYQLTIDFSRDRDDIKLANLAIRKIQRREFSELIDPSLGFQTDENLKNVISCVAELAFRCLQDEKELRPSMSEVFEVLQKIESGKGDAENYEGIDFHHGIGVAQSFAHPSLTNTWMKPQRHQQTL